MFKLSLDQETNNDNDFFGNLERRANLDQLFGVQTRQEDNEDQTLKYQRTKQPQTETVLSTADDQQQTWTTQLAKVATAYKLNESVGKVGVAFLKNTQKAYKIILYKTKTNVLATLTLKLQSEAAQICMQDCYLQFFDDDRNYWSLLFDKDADQQEFIQKLTEYNIQMQHNASNAVAPKQNNAESDTIVENITNSVSTTSNTAATVDAATSDVPHTLHAKTALLTRISKMGQPLPKLATPQQMTSNDAVTTTDYSDSSDTEIIATPILSNKPSIVPRNSKLQTKNQIVPTSNTSFYNNSAVATTINTMETQFLQMLLTENRTQNTEVRMNINKLETKIEKVLDKIDNIHINGNQKLNKDDEIIALEEKLLNLKKENRKLKQTLDNREMNLNAGAVLQNVLRQYEIELQEIGITPANDVEVVLQSLIEQLKKYKNNLQKVEIDCEQQKKLLQSCELELAEACDKHKTSQTKATELETNINTLQETLKNKEVEFATLKQTLLAHQQQSAIKLAEQKTQSELTLKTIMNNLYGNISTKLENSATLRTDQVLAIIGQTIREESFRAIEQMNK